MLGNVSAGAVRPALPGWDGAEVLVGEADGDLLALGPWEGRVLKRVG